MLSTAYIHVKGNKVTGFGSFCSDRKKQNYGHSHNRDRSTNSIRIGCRVSWAAGGAECNSGASKN